MTGELGRRRPLARRVAAAAAVSVAYTLMWVGIVVAFQAIDTPSADSLAEAFGQVVETLLALTLLGHVLWSVAVLTLLRRPRRRGRIALLLVGTPVVVTVGGIVTGERSVGPVSLGVVILVLTPALLAFWAARPTPPTQIQPDEPVSSLPGFLGR